MHASDGNFQWIITIAKSFINMWSKRGKSLSFSIFFRMFLSKGSGNKNVKDCTNKQKSNAFITSSCICMGVQNMKAKFIELLIPLNFS